MTSIVNARLKQIKPSPSMAAKIVVDELRREGREIADFTLGEPDMSTPAHIARAGQQAIADGDIRYTTPNGMLGLRRAIAKSLKDTLGVDYGLDQITVGAGAKQIISAALTAGLEPGDEVIVCAPYWVSYPDMVLLGEGKPVTVVCPESQQFKLSAADLEAAITPRTRWIILNSPSNPSGAVYSAEEMRQITDVLLRHPQVWILSDEIYAPFSYNGGISASPVQVEPRLQSRTLVVNGMSKAYAMTGWRVGYGAGPVDLIKAMSTVMSQSTTCPSAVSQIAAQAALEGDQACVSKMVSVFKERRELIVRRLNDIPGISCATPDGAFYVYANVSGLIGRQGPAGELKTDLDVSLFFLREAGVAVIDGGSYGLSPYVRFSFATSTEIIEQGMDRLAAAVGKLMAG
jgi:aspartate aminotransferase